MCDKCNCNPCCCGCHKIFVQCAPGVAAPPPTKWPPTEEPPTEEPPTEEPPKVGRCTRVQVRFTSIEIKDSGEWTGAHWRLPLMVNGVIVGTFEEEDVYDGNVFSLGYVRTVEIPSLASTVEVKATGGEEFDGGFWDPDDELPEAIGVHSHSDNWGIGTQSVSGSDDEFSYQINYTISCLERQQASFATREEVIAFMRSSLKESGRELKSKRTGEVILKDDNQALAYFLRKMVRKGFSVQDVSSDILVFDGDRNIRQFLRKPARPTPRMRSGAKQKA